MLDLSRVNLNLLVALDALLRTRNVTRAAHTLGLTQPTVSGQLAQLRRLFGDPLLIRSGREFELSYQAQALQQPVQEILSLIERTLESRQSFDPATDLRSFRVSASDYATVMLLGPLSRALEHEAPAVSLHMAPRSANAAQMVRDAVFDVVIEPAELMPGADLPSAYLFEDGWVCAVSSDNDQVGEQLSLERYLQLSHIVFAVGSGAERRLGIADQYLADQGYERQIEFVVETFLVAPLLLPGTNRATLIPGRLAPLVGGAAPLRFFELPVELPRITERMWWATRFSADPAHRWFRARLEQAASDLDLTR